MHPVNALGTDNLPKLMSLESHNATLLVAYMTENTVPDYLVSWAFLCAFPVFFA